MSLSKAIKRTGKVHSFRVNLVMPAASPPAKAPEPAKDPKPTPKGDKKISLEKLKKGSTYKDDLSNLLNAVDSALTPSTEDNRGSEPSQAKLWSRMRNKIRRVKSFWEKQTFMIPNVFKMTAINEEDRSSAFEFNDLSLKGILITSGLGGRLESQASSRSGLAEKEGQGEPGEEEVYSAFGGKFGEFSNLPRDEFLIFDF